MAKYRVTLRPRAESIVIDVEADCTWDAEWAAKAIVAPNVALTVTSCRKRGAQK